MILLPIDIEETKNNRFLAYPECIPFLKVYPDYYKRAGFNKPWIGYFASIDGKKLVGVACYKGKPKDRLGSPTTCGKQNWCSRLRMESRWRIQSFFSY